MTLNWREVNIGELFVELWTKEESANLQNEKQTNVQKQATRQVLDQE